MKKYTKLLSLLLACLMLVSVMLTFTACPGEMPAPGTDPGTTPGGNGTTPGGTTTPTMADYLVDVKSVGGLMIEGCGVMVYTNKDAVGNYVAHAVTDANGRATLNLEVGKEYYVKLEAPAGYVTQRTYALQANGTGITLMSGLIANTDHSDASFSVGDIAQDIEVTTVDGQTLKLSDLFAEGKKMILLNFFYETCSACQIEAPYMQAAYEKYKEEYDDIEIVLLDTLITDTVANATKFRDAYGLTMPVAKADPSIFAAYTDNVDGQVGYPTTAIIDRYGMISLIEVGALTSEAPFNYAFDHFTSDAYVQRTFAGFEELVPEEKPTGTTPNSADIEAALNGENASITYEGLDGDIYWPFAIGENELAGRTDYIYPTNIGKQNSYSLLYAYVELEAGQVLALDYLVSSEQFADILYIAVNDTAVFELSGVKEEWQTCYPVVADKTGTYKVMLTFIKDGSDEASFEGSDAVYLSNFRVVTQAEISTPTYLPRDAANDLKEDGMGYENYITPVYNEEDGYYHVGDKNGPLLMAKLMQPNKFVPDTSVYTLIYEDITAGEAYALRLQDYCGYAVNGTLTGLVAVTEELKGLLQTMVAECGGINDYPELEWLENCVYYDAYPAGTPHLDDPIRGLTYHAAYEIVEGETVTVTYDRILVPRGLWHEFIPTKSGVYRIVSDSEYAVNAWLRDAQGHDLYEYAIWDRFVTAGVNNCDMYYYMEAGTPYYINVAFWVPEIMWTLTFDVSFVAEELDLFRVGSTGPWTYYVDENGNIDQEHLIAAGVKTTVDEEGYCRVLLVDGSYGSYLYADFTYATEAFSNSISELIEIGAFDFTTSADDDWILELIDTYGKDGVADYLKTVWEDAEEYALNYEAFKVDDVLNGRMHPLGEDMTERMREILAESLITAETCDKSEKEVGCVKVTEELRNILTLLLDKHVFADIEEGYTKMCYYYQYLGADAAAEA